MHIKLDCKEELLLQDCNGRDYVVKEDEQTGTLTIEEE